MQNQKWGVLLLFTISRKYIFVSEVDWPELATSTVQCPFITVQLKIFQYLLKPQSPMSINFLFFWKTSLYPLNGIRLLKFSQPWKYPENKPWLFQNISLLLTRGLNLRSRIRAKPYPFFCSFHVIACFLWNPCWWKSAAKESRCFFSLKSREY